MTALVPRVVVVTRQTEYAALLARHGTREQARFFLATRGRTLEEVEGVDHLLRAAVETVQADIPIDWRRARVDRNDLDRFLFEPEDVVIAVGQDGLVANTAKYLSGQLVIGCNPDRSRYEGILVRHAAGEVPELLAAAAAGRDACPRGARVCREDRADRAPQRLAGHALAFHRRPRGGGCGEPEGGCGPNDRGGDGSTGGAGNPSDPRRQVT